MADAPQDPPVRFERHGERIVQIPPSAVLAKLHHKHEGWEVMLVIEIYRHFSKPHPHGRDEFTATLVFEMDDREWNGKHATEKHLISRERFVSISDIWNWVHDASDLLMRCLFPYAHAQYMRGMHMVKDLFHHGRDKRNIALHLRHRAREIEKLLAENRSD